MSMPIIYTMGSLKNSATIAKVNLLIVLYCAFNNFVDRAYENPIKINEDQN